MNLIAWEKTDILWTVMMRKEPYLRCHGWFSHKMILEEWLQKFHTDDVSLPRRRVEYNLLLLGPKLHALKLL